MNALASFHYTAQPDLTHPHYHVNLTVYRMKQTNVVNAVAVKSNVGCLSKTDTH